MNRTRVWHSAEGAGLTVTLLDGPAGLRLRGGADMLTASALHEAIKTLAAGAREIRLELEELRFIDVAGVRELTALARRPARPRLILDQPPPSLTRLIALLWPDGDQFRPGLAARLATAPASKRPDHDDGSPRRTQPRAGQLTFACRQLSGHILRN